jgi:N-acetylated-alpha-linked acidic dipeptidase
MYYGADYGVYHSIYENPHWMETIVDPDYAYHELMASMLGTAALRMSEADLLPFDLTAAASDWHDEIEELEQDSERAANAITGKPLDLAALKALADQWRAAALDLDLARKALLSDAAVSEISPQRWLAWNRQLMDVERSFYVEEGLPGSPWSRNLFSALRFNASGTTLPGLRWALEDRDRSQLEQQRSSYAAALERARDLTRALADDLRARGASNVE